MDKPQMKREVAIEWVGEKTRTIGFFASNDALEDIKQFGHVSAEGARNIIILNVDPRFDFAEVVAWIKETWK